LNLIFFSSIEDESFCKEIFEEYIAQLKEHAKENDTKRKEEKHRDVFRHGVADNTAKNRN